jgi:TIGR03009 family protein
MRPLAIALLAGSLTIASERPARAGGAAPASRPDDPEAGRKLDDLLARWEARSRDLRALSVKFRRIDDSHAFNTKRTYAGRLHIQGPDRLYVDSYETKDDEPIGDFSERMVLDGKDLYHFVGLTHKVWIFRREPDAARTRLEYGPLAFLFGIDAARLRERFEIEILREDADMYTLRATPKKQEDRDEFSQALIKLDRRRLFPVAIRLTMPRGPDTRTYTCSTSDLDENPMIKPSWFDALAMAETLKDRDGWAVVDSPAPFHFGVSSLRVPSPSSK